MNDLEQISAVLVRYATGIDSRDWDLFRTCFTQDCQLDYGVIGRWNSCDEVTAYMIRAHSGPSLHRLSNFDIRIDGDRAWCRTYVDALVFGPGGIGSAHAIGYYDDELVRGADGWKIARRRHTSIRLKFLGLLSIIPSWMVLRVSAIASRRLNSVSAKNG
ncbi:nuclear transport factor 2 family protein [Ketobacter sp. MCCC 1A13808]|uniref:nuclear transport factor 2 family protein n=1 Tax=Ketobacter sp. MCCC 1A13808 TaxID=2602738 RepID=UPI000F10A384|nr:nuclear transport factor 2 family protein [Ketobacter sp. MCCC 1A13808]MVF12134.1 nuclear transport factor 2 family protein [Ketobacter sp. MCCC 1A13808]RLP53192.1 MAG: nuclear transport factor 2 family protein [Ketobacter sp.]